MVNRPGKRNQQRVMDMESLHKAAECLRTIAHPVRLKMIQLMLGDTPLTVGELADACAISQPQASEHLRLMQRCGFLKSQREGREVYYDVAEPNLADLMSCLEKRFG